MAKQNKKSENIKVTAILPSDLINDVKDLAKGKNLTESLVIALNDWAALQRIRKLNEQIKKKPLKFKDDLSAESVRDLNRRKRF